MTQSGLTWRFPRMFWTGNAAELCERDFRTREESGREAARKHAEAREYLAQKDFKRLVAYSSVAHMGFVVLGIFALTVNGLQGGLIVMISHGISTGGTPTIDIPTMMKRKDKVVESLVSGVAMLMKKNKVTWDWSNPPLPGLS